MRVLLVACLLASACAVGALSNDVDHVSLLQTRSDSVALNDDQEYVQDQSYTTADDDLIDEDDDMDDVGTDDENENIETDSDEDDEDEYDEDNVAEMDDAKSTCRKKCGKKYRKWNKKGMWEKKGFGKTCKSAKCVGCSFCKEKPPTPRPTRPCRQSCHNTYNKFANKGKAETGKNTICKKYACSGCPMCTNTEAPTPTPTPAPTPEACKATFTGQDLAGADVTSVRIQGTSDAQLDAACCDACEGNSQCTFWVRSSGNTGPATCWLKKYPGRYFPNAGRRGGMK